MESVEIWRDIPGYEGLYQVSNLGRIKSLPKYNFKTARIMQPTISKKHGRESVILCKETAKKRIAVHRLVAMAFVPNPYGYDEINHMDENPLNNCADNLEWCTRSYNMHYNDLHKRIKRYKKPVEGTDGTKKVKYAAVRYAKKDGYDPSGILHSIRKNVMYKGLYWRYTDAD